MLANTYTLDGTADRLVTRINQDNYGSVYRFTATDGSEIVTMQIRHSKVKPTASEGPKDNHNVEITRVFPATATTLQRTEKAYITFQLPAGTVDVDVVRWLSNFLSAGTFAILGNLVNWES